MEITISGIPIIDQVWGQMAEYWPSSFFFCIFMDQGKKNIASLRIKNDLFISRGGKESQLYW